jgi:hypothetical protein
MDFRMDPKKRENDVTLEQSTVHKDGLKLEQNHHQACDFPCLDCSSEAATETKKKHKKRT